MLMVILMMSFLLKPTDSNRFCICIYVLSGLIAYLFVIAQYTPILPYDTILDSWLNLCFVNVMCVTFIHSLLAYIKIHEDALEEARIVHQAQSEAKNEYELMMSRSSAATASNLYGDTMATSTSETSEIEMTGLCIDTDTDTGATSTNDSPRSGGGASEKAGRKGGRTPRRASAYVRSKLGQNLTIPSGKERDDSHDSDYWSRKRLVLPYLGIMPLFQLIDIVLMISLMIVFVICSSAILTGHAITADDSQ